MNNYQNYYLKSTDNKKYNTANNLFDPYNGFVHGNMFPNLYDPYKISKPYDIRPLNEQAELLTSIDSLTFALIDIGLYLDIYSNDKDMIQLFNHYNKQLNDLEQRYSEKYGPLKLTGDGLEKYPWAWEYKPWPWENK